jgi:AraC-like DNA-binding protein
MGFAAVSSSDAETALRTIYDHVAIRNRCFHYSWNQNDVGVSLRLAPRIDMGNFALFIEQATLFTFVRLLQTAIGAELVKELEIFASWPNFDDKRLPQPVADLRITYGAKLSAIQLPTHLSKQRCLTADKTLYKAAISSCELERHYLTGTFAPKVKRLLKKTAMKWRSQTDIAGQLNISKRTLIRKLRAENTSYRQLRDELSFELAQYYLLLSQKPISEIAVAVGFADASNFSRTFRRWCGNTPYTYRSKLDKRK